MTIADSKCRASPLQLLTKKYGMASIQNCNFSGHQDLPNTPVLLILTLELKTHLSITIRLLRQLSKPNRYVSCFWNTLYTIVNCSLLVLGVVVIVKRHDGRLGLVDDRVLGGEVENQQELIQNQN